jgi:PAS domain S-box-containing protein
MQADAGTLRPTHIFRIIVLILAAVSIVAVLSTYRFIARYSASVRTQQVILEIEKSVSGVGAMESAARGYAMTGDARFLEPLRSATANLDDSLARLRTLAGTDDDIAASLRDFELAAKTRTADIQNLRRIAAAGAPRREIAAAALAGEAVMDRLRSEAAEVIAAEQKERLTREALLERQAVVTMIALALGVALSLIVLVWLFRRLNHEVERRLGTEKDLRVLNLELEDHIQERTAEVNRARDLFSAVVENLPDMVVLKEPWNDEFRYLLVNPAGEAVLGLDRSEILGKSERDLFPAEEASKVIEANKDVIKSGQPRTFTDRSLTTPSGERTVETRMVPISNAAGSPGLILAMVRDVTDAKSSEAQLRQLQRIDAVGRLTGGVAHDFNNLLAVIMGNVELVRDTLPEGSESAAIADEALDATRRGADLVRQLLAFARKQHLEPVAVDLNEQLPTMIPLLQRTLGEHIRVQVNSGRQLWRALIDPTQVDDALVNMAINARDAMPKGGTLTIETANIVLDEDYASHEVEVEPGEYVMLAVSDTGTGMAPDVAARVFEPFFTTKAEGKGTGLGLSQVFGWVKQSGGHIKIYSELGHGTTIKLYLPRSVAEKESAEEPQAAVDEIGGHETIFVVEDNPNVRRTVNRQLSDLGYSVVEADDAEAALEMIRSGAEFDLILTDVVMPGGMSGYELAAAVETLRPGTKVVFTSGYTELAATGLQASRKGPLISKPYSKRDLGRAIRSALSDKASETG